MIGTRIQPDENGYQSGKMNPGEYVRVAPLRRGDGLEFSEAEKAEWWTKPYWMCCTPNGHVGTLSGHQVTEHEDGTITVSPSILIRRPVPGTSTEVWDKIQWEELWHGWLEKGMWRSC